MRNDSAPEKAKGDIFIVDDELENIQTISSLLKRHGYDVRAAREGWTALSILNATPADLILLDIVMPGMNGYEVCAELKQRVRTRNIPVIFISALDDVSDKNKAFKAGGVDYIVKPFQEEEVLMRLHTHLSLSALRKNLQQRVEARTYELMAANAELREEIAVRRQAENRLRRFSVAIESAAEDIIITDRDGVIEYVNPAFEQITGYTAEEAAGKTPGILKSGRHDAAFYNAMWQTLLNRKTWKGRLVNRKKDGTLFEQDANISPILDAAGEISGFVSVKRDVTEQEMLKKQLIQAQKMEAIGTLSGGIAHDFNNILGGIIGYMELAIEEAAELPQKRGKLVRYLERTLEAGNRAIHLVKRILQFSRRDMSTMNFLDVRPLVKETVKLLRAALPSTIDVKLNLAAENDVIFADPTQIHQVIMNLCTNAYQAMRGAGGRLGVSLENVRLTEVKRFHTMTVPPGEYLKIAVTDTGCGIPAESLDRIFEPYFTTKAPDEGTGLGLSVTLGIVVSHGGLIEAESAPGKGATFSVFLPVDRTERPALRVIDDDAPAGNGERVLMVDDEDFFLDAIQEHIEMLGYAVTAVQRSPDALAMFRADPTRFDLIITDQTMPELTGVQLVREIRRLNQTVPVILCTGYSETVTAETAQKFGISKFLLKPVHRSDLAKAMHDALQKE